MPGPPRPVLISHAAEGVPSRRRCWWGGSHHRVEPSPTTRADEQEHPCRGASAIPVPMLISPRRTIRLFSRRHDSCSVVTASIRTTASASVAGSLAPVARAWRMPPGRLGRTGSWLSPRVITKARKRRLGFSPAGPRSQPRTTDWRRPHVRRHDHNEPITVWLLEARDTTQVACSSESHSPPQTADAVTVTVESVRVRRLGRDADTGIARVAPAAAHRCRAQRSDSHPR
jgi:hypothetical protein